MHHNCLLVKSRVLVSKIDADSHQSKWFHHREDINTCTLNTKWRKIPRGLGVSLVWVTTYRLLGVKPIRSPMITYYELDPTPTPRTQFQCNVNRISIVSLNTMQMAVTLLSHTCCYGNYSQLRYSVHRMIILFNLASFKNLNFCTWNTHNSVAFNIKLWVCTGTIIKMHWFYLQ